MTTKTDAIQVWTLESISGIEPFTCRKCAAWITVGAVPLSVVEIRKVLRRSRTPPDPAYFETQAIRS
jgi:hypothetical protein